MEVDTTSKRIPLHFPLEKSSDNDGPPPPDGLLEQLKDLLDMGVSYLLFFEIFEREFYSSQWDAGPGLPEIADM